MSHFQTSKLSYLLINNLWIPLWQKRGMVLYGLVWKLVGIFNPMGFSPQKIFNKMISLVETVLISVNLDVNNVWHTARSVECTSGLLEGLEEFSADLLNLGNLHSLLHHLNVSLIMHTYTENSQRLKNESVSLFLIRYLI